MNHDKVFLQKQHLFGVLLALAISLAFTSSAGAEQEARFDKVFEERIGVEIVNIDVVVTDKKGRAVSGLTEDDFELRMGFSNRLATMFSTIWVNSSVQLIGRSSRVTTCGRMSAI